MTPLSLAGAVAPPCIPLSKQWENGLSGVKKHPAADRELRFFRIFRLGKPKKRADERTRTADLLITSELLYQLSYVGLFRAQSIPQRTRAFTRSWLT